MMLLPVIVVLGIGGLFRWRQRMRAEAPT
jgi:hypothetical protein